MRSFSARRAGRLRARLGIGLRSAGRMGEDHRTIRQPPVVGELEVEPGGVHVLEQQMPCAVYDGHDPEAELVDQVTSQGARACACAPAGARRALASGRLGAVDGRRRRRPGFGQAGAAPLGSSVPVSPVAASGPPGSGGRPRRGDEGHHCTGLRPAAVRR